MVIKLNLDDMFEYGLFQDPMSLGDNLEEVRSAITNFNLDSPGIDILTFQAGVGKTYHTNELLKNIDSYLLVTGAHELLKGEYSALKATKHWEGFPEKCQEYKAQVQKLDSFGVSKRFICKKQDCDKRSCPYWKQFNTKKAIAPYHFLTTDRVLDKDGNFKFDMLLVDEAMEYGTEYTLKQESLIESIQAMSKYENVKFLEEINWDEDLFDYIQEKFKLINSKKYSSLTNAINEKQWDDVKDIANFRPYNLVKYYYYHNIYGNNSCYYEPLLYTVFDLARQKLPIIMLDASFDVKAYEVTLARYNFEHKQLPRDLFFELPLRPMTYLSTMVYESNITNKHKTIHRMDKDNFYYKKGFFNNNEKLTGNGKKTGRELTSFINRTKRKHNNIGIITYLHLEPYFMGLGETEHFFNLRGSNKFKNVDVLFIIGTPQKDVSDILGGYNKLCLTDITPNDIYKPTYKIIDGKYCLDHGDETFLDDNFGRGYSEKKPSPYRIISQKNYEKPKNYQQQYHDGEIDLDLWYDFSEYNMNQDESEKYQAIHRARPFLNDKPIIYVFGDIPEKIKEEFNVDYYDKGATRIHFSRSYRGVYPLVLWHAIVNYFTNTSSTSKEIAKRLRLYKKDKKGYNTSFITKIKKGISPEDVVNVDKFLKVDINATFNKIKQKHPHIKMDKDLVEYFIFYAREGSFINL